MNIYFACSITGGREFESVYQAIIVALMEDDHEIPTAHLAEGGVMALEAVASPDEIYARDVAWIQGCDALIAEVSTPSHGVGYEIGYALGLGKPVLCCHQADRPVSKMISGNPDSNLTLRAYEKPDQVIEIIREFMIHKTKRL